jgi:phage anti-repressor protein/phage antirepressor YoqD-like protein
MEKIFWRATMKEIIPVRQQTIGQQEIKTVNARELHAFLEVKKDFSDWIKDRINKYGFTENQDYVCSPVLGSEGRGGQNRIDYQLSIDMAKELSMVERNEKGKEARLYFLECEKVANQPQQSIHQVLSDPSSMRTLLLTYTEKVISLEATVAEQAPKVAALDLIATADGMLNITNTAKTLQINPNAKLFRYLAENMWIYRRAGGKNYVAYQQRIQQGLLSHKVTTVTTGDGREKIIEQVLVTPKGLAKLAKVFPEVRA